LWDVTSAIQVFGNISKSSEAPTFNEIPPPGRPVPVLVPQEAWTYEIGTRGNLPGLRWDLALGTWTAYIEVRNLTDEVYIASARVTTQAAINSPLFEPGTGRAVYGGIQYRS
jgi:outer membrane receptor protein involved in Fe transport